MACLQSMLSCIWQWNTFVIYQITFGKSMEGHVQCVGVYVCNTQTHIYVHVYKLHIHTHTCSCVLGLNVNLFYFFLWKHKHWKPAVLDYNGVRVQWIPYCRSYYLFSFLPVLVASKDNKKEVASYLVYCNK